MKRKILIAVSIIISVLLLNQIVYTIFVPDRPYGRDWEPMFNFANSKWVSDDGRVTLLVDDEWIMTCFVETDDYSTEFDIGYFGEEYTIYEYVPNTEEYGRHGNRIEHWCVQRANAERTIVKVYYENYHGVHIFEDGSKVTFYRVDNTSQTE